MLPSFQELFYSEDGDVIEERVLGIDEKNNDTNVWSFYNEENLKLYADNNPLWEKDDIIVGGIEVYKCIKRSEDNDE